MYYTYLVGWSNLDRWYYGSRTCKSAHPRDLWKNYFTSSKIVKEYRHVYGEPDIIEIRKTFDDSNKCRKWEADVLHRLKADKSDKWLNRHPGYKNFSRAGKPGTFTGRKHTDKTKKKIGFANKGKLIGSKNPMAKEENRLKVSIAKKGSHWKDSSNAIGHRQKGISFEERYGDRAAEIRYKVGNGLRGKKRIFSESHIANIKLAQQKRWANYHNDV